MKPFLNPTSFIQPLFQLTRWALLVVPVAIFAGSASALFLWLMDRATDYRLEQPWLLFLLPLAGLVLGLLYHKIGKTVEGGNNLILEQIHSPSGGIPKRMAPLILFATVATHFFGGSAGREGTAVQMGGSIASTYTKWFGFSESNRRVLLMAGIAAGFGSVFGTPLAGAIFALEVLVVGKIQYKALIPTLIASVIGDATCSAWGVKHTLYAITPAIPGASPLEIGLLGKCALAGAIFGLAGLLFSEMTHGLQALFRRVMPWPPGRPVIGGLVVIALVFLLKTHDFLGLGVVSSEPGAVTIVSAFSAGGAHAWSWWWKILFTAVTLASGFKGGEVTPLFFIGATLGNTLSVLLGAPVDLFAGLGFIAVFAGAAKTPVACTLMGIELFGAHYGIHFAMACFIAYFFSGHSGIYLSQRVQRDQQSEVPKHLSLPSSIPLREARELSLRKAVHLLRKLRGRFTAPSPVRSEHRDR